MLRVAARIVSQPARPPAACIDLPCAAGTPGADAPLPQDAYLRVLMDAPAADAPLSDLFESIQVVQLQAAPPALHVAALPTGGARDMRACQSAALAYEGLLSPLLATERSDRLRAPHVPPFAALVPAPRHSELLAGPDGWDCGQWHEACSIGCAAVACMFPLPLHSSRVWASASCSGL